MPAGTRRVACVIKTPQPCTPFGTHARNPRDSRALPVPVRVSQDASLRAAPLHGARGGFMPARSASVHRLAARASPSRARPLSELGVRSSGRCRTAGRSPRGRTLPTTRPFAARRLCAPTARRPVAIIATPATLRLSHRARRGVDARAHEAKGEHMAALGGLEVDAGRDGHVSAVRERQRPSPLTHWRRAITRRSASSDVQCGPVPSVRCRARGQSPSSSTCRWRLAPSGWPRLRAAVTGTAVHMHARGIGEGPPMQCGHRRAMLVMQARACSWTGMFACTTRWVIREWFDEKSSVRQMIDWQ